MYSQRAAKTFAAYSISEIKKTGSLILPPIGRTSERQPNKKKPEKSTPPKKKVPKRVIVEPSSSDEDESSEDEKKKKSASSTATTTASSSTIVASKDDASSTNGIPEATTVSSIDDKNEESKPPQPSKSVDDLTLLEEMARESSSATKERKTNNIKAKSANSNKRSGEEEEESDSDSDSDVSSKPKKRKNVKANETNAIKKQKQQHENDKKKKAAEQNKRAVKRKREDTKRKKGEESSDSDEDSDEEEESSEEDTKKRKSKAKAKVVAKKRTKKEESSDDDDDDEDSSEEDDDSDDSEEETSSAIVKSAQHNRKGTPRKTVRNSDDEDEDETETETLRYIRLRQNQYLHRRPTNVSKDDVPICCCIYIPGISACNENCINRLVMIECHPKYCPCGVYCENQRFQKAQNAKLTKFVADKKGFGLKAGEDIQRGSFIIEYVGEVIDIATCKKRLEETKHHKHFYFLTLNTHECIDASRKGNLARYINHSCNPNAQTQKWYVKGEMRVGIFAIRDIKAGEEVTFDYKYERIGTKKQECLCGELNCRGYLGAPKKPEKKIAKKKATDRRRSGGGAANRSTTKLPVSSPIARPKSSSVAPPINMKDPVEYVLNFPKQIALQNLLKGVSRSSKLFLFKNVNTAQRTWDKIYDTMNQVASALPSSDELIKSSPSSPAPLSPSSAATSTPCSTSSFSSSPLETKISTPPPTSPVTESGSSDRLLATTPSSSSSSHGDSDGTVASSDINTGVNDHQAQAHQSVVSVDEAPAPITSSSSDTQI